jgi:Fur family transcriptional regulator, ferric uptake regulator
VRTRSASPELRDLHRAAEARLAERDQRYTANRRRIVEALAEASSPQTLPQLLHRRPALTQSSTYRNLTTLEDAQVVRRIVSGSEHAHYELAEHLTEHHHHLVCVECGSITDVTLAAPLEARLERAFADAASGRRFRPAGHSIDIYGHCADCAPA